MNVCECVCACVRVGIEDFDVCFIYIYNMWEDCIKRDLERVGEEWRTTGKPKRNWRLWEKNGELQENLRGIGDCGRRMGNYRKT